ncbi:hypothetical protein GGH12_002016 [Coemansia sp. RSA 1822]|nr:hypothetical protein LPJ76_004725 [Coemansia sp. RSA 638]KAJ2544291.1 hypothetical protein GGF49_001399 [Coemansia sp. RSA 1853]KAJ2564366.1 hypothetical protein GGH12_002016 [Coemansia sp. RSA 1822]
MARSYLSTLSSVELPLWQVLLLGGAALLVGSYVSQPQLLKPTACTTSKKEKEEQTEKKTEDKIEEPLEVPRQYIKLAQNEGTKMVLVVRTDLKMTGGKVASQCAHATLECFRKALKYAPEILKVWEYMGQAKITVKCRSQSEMEELEVNARKLGLVTHLFKDDGRTQVASGALTVLGVGPGPISVINQVTGHLKLY